MTEAPDEAAADEFRDMLALIKAAADRDDHAQRVLVELLAEDGPHAARVAFWLSELAASLLRDVRPDWITRTQEWARGLG